MAKRSTKSGGLAVAKRKFAGWRAQRPRGMRIPDRLWRVAVRVASDHGVSRVAQELGLDYYALKRRTEGAKSSQGGSEGEIEFFQVGGPLWRRSCKLEFESDQGASLRMELEGMSAEEVVAVVRGLWDRHE